MAREIIIASAHADPRKIKTLLRTGGVWFYAGENLERFSAFGECFQNRLTHRSFNQDDDFVNSARDLFVEWTEAVHRAYGNDPFHWLSETFSSNPYSSKLYFHCLCLAWFNRLLNAGRESIILVAESRAVLSIAADLASTQPDNIVRRIDLYREWLRFVSNMAASVRQAGIVPFTILRYLLARFNPPTKEDREEIKKTSVVIDTFLFRDSFDQDGRFTNKYFAELCALLDKLQVPIAFYPLFHRVGLADFRLLIGNIRRNGTKFILAEDYLRLPDYFHAFCMALGHLRHLECVPRLGDIDVQRAVNEEHWVNFFSASCYWSFLFRGLPMRLAENGFSPRRYINWNESQTQQRAMVYGFHRFLPQVEVVGGKPFMPPLNHIAFFPTPMERAQKYAPDRVVTCGQKLKTAISKYDKNGCYDVGASFRYGYLWDLIDKSEDPTDSRAIAVFLPYGLLIAKFLLSLSATALRAVLSQGYDVIIKGHPANNRKDLLSIMEALKLTDDRLKISEEKAEFILSKSLTIISSASSVACEAVCLGIPVLLMGMPIGLDLNLQDHLPPSMWRIAYTAEELETNLNTWALKHPLSFVERRTAGRNFLKQYFEPNSEQAVTIYIEDAAGCA